MDFAGAIAAGRPICVLGEVNARTRERQAMAVDAGIANRRAAQVSERIIECRFPAVDGFSAWRVIYKMARRRIRQVNRCQGIDSQAAPKKLDPSRRKGPDSDYGIFSVHDDRKRG